MAKCKDCLHVEVCCSYLSTAYNKCKLATPDFKLLKNIECDECQHFKDHSRFVELQTAHWIRHSPDKNIMRGFHKQGIGRGMGENSIFWTCSNCGNWGVLSYKYCPFCSAKIEEAEQALKERENESIFKSIGEISEQD